MDKKNKKKSILEMARGSFMERVDYEMPKLIDNILDPNTKAAFKRKLDISLVITASEHDRSDISVECVIKPPKLAPTIPIRTSLYISGADSNGELQVVEMVPQVPGQMNMSGEEQEAPATLKMINFA